MRKRNLPLFNHLLYTWNLVYMCVIHYEDRVQEWPWLHLIQYASDEISEFVPTGEGMINDFEMNDTIQGNGRKN